jgi:hypothetical protein
MPSLTLSARPSLDLFKNHLETPMGKFYSQFTNWLLLYFVLGGIFILEGIVALTLYKGPALLISRMDFTTVYAFHTAVTYTCCQLAIDLLACKVLRGWGCFSKRTVGRQWLIWLAGFALAFIVHRTVVLCLVHIYAPEIVTYYSDSQNIRPGHWAVFMYTLLFWIAGAYLAVKIIIQWQKKLFAEDRSVDTKSGAHYGSLAVSMDHRVIKIPFPAISHISVEDHYSRIFYMKNDKLQNIFIRKPLKALQQSLPNDHFFQVHRSYLVNLNHVSGLFNNNRKLKMRWAQNGVALPVSRHRLSDLRDRLQEYPSAQMTEDPGST